MSPVSRPILSVAVVLLRARGLVGASSSALTGFFGRPLLVGCSGGAIASDGSVRRLSCVSKSARMDLAVTKPCGRGTGCSDDSDGNDGELILVLRSQAQRINTDVVASARKTPTFLIRLAIVNVLTKVQPTQNTIACRVSRLCRMPYPYTFPMPGQKELCCTRVDSRFPRRHSPSRSRNPLLKQPSPNYTTTLFARYSTGTFRYAVLADHSCHPADA